MHITVSIKKSPLIHFTVLLLLASCGGGGGSTPPPTASLSASKSNVEKGDLLTLTWSSTNASSCSASGSWSGPLAISGTQSVTAATAGALTYTVTCSSGSLTATAEAKVTAVEKPTATLALNQTSALTDEKITLTWSSTNATACTLSGETTGSVSSAGSKELAVLGAGSKTISISCAGSLSSATASVSFTASVPTTYTVSTDATKLSYPSSYKVVTLKSSDLTNDPCKLDYSAVTYPQTWMGKYALPQVSGAPLKSTVQRGINLKDIMLTDNPTFNPNCKGSLKAEFSKLVDRLQKLGVEVFSVTQWHWMGKKSDGSWYVIKAEDSFGPISDSDLTYLVTAAHAVGIKVMMINQIQAIIENNVAYLPPANRENYQKWFAAMTPFMEERGKYFQSIGLDIWELGCNVCIYGDRTNNQADADFHISEYLKLLPVVKKSFTGKLALQGGLEGSEARKLFDQVDILMVNYGPNNYNPQPAESLSVASIKAAITDYGLLNYYDRPGQTILIQFGIQSRVNAFTLPGYMEETGCTAGIGDLNTTDAACIQKNTTPDFSLQAIYLEAHLEAIAALSLKNAKLMVVANDFWITDSMVSGVPNGVFPNIGSSLRNKPAEGVLKTWYAK